MIGAEFHGSGHIVKGFEQFLSVDTLYSHLIHDSRLLLKQRKLSVDKEER
jgi:hypothetical protein